jgi:hypothetical protein
MTLACVSFGGNLMEKMVHIVLEQSTVIEIRRNKRDRMSIFGMKFSSHLSHWSLSHLSGSFSFVSTLAFEQEKSVRESE